MNDSGLMQADIDRQRRTQQGGGAQVVGHDLCQWQREQDVGNPHSKLQHQQSEQGPYSKIPAEPSACE